MKQFNECALHDYVGVPNVAKENAIHIPIAHNNDNDSKTTFEAGDSEATFCHVS